MLMPARTTLVRHAHARTDDALGHLARLRGDWTRVHGASLWGATHDGMRTAIEAIVARVPQWDGRSPVIRPLPRPRPGAPVFAVAVDGHEYVVRQPAEAPLLGLGPANTAEATRRAAELGIGPRRSSATCRNRTP